MIKRPLIRLKDKIEKENLWLFVLSILYKKKRYGNELRAIIKDKYGFLTGTMTAYKVLYLLKTDGYVKSEKNGKFVYYQITKKGRKELSEAKKLLSKYVKV